MKRGRRLFAKIYGYMGLTVFSGFLLYHAWSLDGGQIMLATPLLALCYFFMYEFFWHIDNEEAKQ